MKKNYLVDSEKKELFEIADQNADDCVSSSDDEGNQAQKPEDLRQWIATPDKFQASQAEEHVQVPTKLDL